MKENRHVETPAPSVDGEIDGWTDVWWPLLQIVKKSGVLKSDYTPIKLGRDPTGVPLEGLYPIWPLDPPQGVVKSGWKREIL